MKALHIITPVKDSLESTLETIDAIMSSKLTWPHSYTIYNDFSTPETTSRLIAEADRQGFTLINLSDITNHPSPNYRLVLQEAQRKALEADAGLLIVESDVIVHPDTLQRLADGAMSHPECGIAAAVTVDDNGKINYPYLYAAGQENKVIDSRKHCSFCCSLLTPALLKTFDFGDLDETKSWYDVTISHKSLKLGLKNYLFTTLPVVHHPHASRPWKQLKYSNPLKYYWRKFTRGLDKI
ncbi:MAG: glycosyltransferase family 2 protein [Muribaculaceae bacterium]|nr:glycosyltransferase family 2 protein [Muribaculaceae bacterium]